MTIEKLFSGLQDINEKIMLKEKTKERLENKTNVLDKEISSLKDISSAITGLRETELREKEKKNYDPGKSDTAYYFVSQITENNIIAAKKFEPELYEKCPKCETKQPVIMWYAQVYDSDEGDEWAKEAFVICCDKKQVIKKAYREHRF